MKLISTTIMSGVAVAILAGPASAQFSPELDRSDMQGRVTLTLPFGESGKDRTAKSAPKLSFGLRNETYRSDHVSWMLRSEAEVRELNFSLTLDETRSVLLNDQILFQPDVLMAKEGEGREKSGSLDTYDKTVLTVIGVSLATIAGSIIILAD